MKLWAFISVGNNFFSIACSWIQNCIVYLCIELPSAPGQLQLTSVHSRSAELQWLDEDIDPLLEYRVQLTRPGTIGWTFNQTIEARGRSLVTLPHLHPFTIYEVQVNAINSAGIGPPSAPLLFQTHEEVPSGPVRHVQAESKSSRSALVSWLVRI